jgi:hypothetical protein
METKDHVSCGIHRSHAPADTGLCLVASGTVTDGVILGGIGIFVCKGARRSPCSNGSGRHQGSLRIPGRSAPEFRCSAGSQSRYAPDEIAGQIIGGTVGEKIGSTVAPLEELSHQAYHLNFGGNYEDTEVAWTMRQRAVQEMGSSALNARQYLGKEAALMHQ